VVRPATLDDFLDQLLARVPTIDRERVYLSGLSMGAKGVGIGRRPPRPLRGDRAGRRTGSNPSAAAS
jgi:hypothetical protein